jgi:hypothetical protein
LRGGRLLGRRWIKDAKPHAPSSPKQPAQGLTLASCTLCYRTNRRLCVATGWLSAVLPDQVTRGTPQTARSCMVANAALSKHLHTVSGSDRAPHQQQERCVTTPKPDTVLHTASESAGCNWGAGTLPELCSECATHGPESELCLCPCFCLFKWRPETELNRRHADFQDLAYR